VRAITLVASGSPCASATALALHCERASSSRNALAASCRCSPLAVARIKELLLVRLFAKVRNRSSSSFGLFCLDY
jgi:hypothetical protein